LSSSETIRAAPPPSGEFVRSRGPWRQALGRFRRRPVGVAAVVVLLAFAIVAVLTPRIAPYSGAQLFFEYLDHPQPPSFHGGHLLGTDVIGHDMLTQLLWAIRESMFGAVGCAAGATAIGVVVGAVAGYAGGALDAVVEWLVGVVVTVPALVVLILVVVYSAPVPLWAFPVTLALYLWTYVARAVRASVVSLRAREFVEAAHAAGASATRIVAGHLLPNTVGTVLVAATAVAGQAIVLIATADYFGLGNQQSDRPTLGGLVANAAKGTPSGYAPWWLYAIPAFTLGLLLVCLNFASDTLDDVLEPGRTR
jgi:peptide/nickel transport system permease protein